MFDFHYLAKIDQHIRAEKLKTPVIDIAAAYSYFRVLFALGGNGPPQPPQNPAPLNQIKMIQEG